MPYRPEPASAGRGRSPRFETRVRSGLAIGQSCDLFRDQPDNEYDDRGAEYEQAHVREPTHLRVGIRIVPEAGQ